jgi:hypothetical protein
MAPQNSEDDPYKSNDTAKVGARSFGDKLDNYLWGEHPISKEPYSVDPIKNLEAAPWVSQHLLNFWRIFSAIAITCLEAGNLRLINPAFLTHWAIYFCMAAFISQTLHLAKTDLSLTYPKTNWSKVGTPFTLWKFAIFFTELALIFESVIVVIFWTLIFPQQDRS